MMSEHHIAAKSQEMRDKVNVAPTVSGMAYMERLNMSVVGVVVVREQPKPL